MPVVPAPPVEAMPRIEMLLVPELSMLHAGREAGDVLEVLDAAHVHRLLGERGHADRHLAEALLVAGRGHDDFLQRPCGGRVSGCRLLLGDSGAACPMRVAMVQGIAPLAETRLRFRS